MGSKIFHCHRLERIITVDAIVSLFYGDLNPLFSSGGESHDFWEFVYVDKGAVLVETDLKSFSLKRGQICFHQPKEYHHHSSDDNMEASVCIAAFYCDSPLMARLSGQHFLLQEEHAGVLFQLLKYGSMLFTSIVDSVDELKLIKSPKTSLACEQMVLCYLEAFLASLFIDKTTEQAAKNWQLAATARNQQRQFVVEAADYIQKHISERIMVEDICNHLLCSKSKLFSSFKSVTGKTVVEYINYAKIEKAAGLLRKGDLNLSQIADRLGFCNANYFSNTFKKYMGMYPSQYAASIKSKESIQLLISPRHD